MLSFTDSIPTEQHSLKRVQVKSLTPWYLFYADQTWQLQQSISLFTFCYDQLIIHFSILTVKNSQEDPDPSIMLLSIYVYYMIFEHNNLKIISLSEWIAIFDYGTSWRSLYCVLAHWIFLKRYMLVYFIILCARCPNDNCRSLPTLSTSIDLFYYAAQQAYRCSKN